MIWLHDTWKCAQARVKSWNPYLSAKSYKNMRNMSHFEDFSLKDWNGYFIPISRTHYYCSYTHTWKYAQFPVESASEILLKNMRNLLRLRILLYVYFKPILKIYAILNRLIKTVSLSKTLFSKYAKLVTFWRFFLKGL